jgi:hypothetical protein
VATMKMHDILLNTKRGLEWICEIYADDINEAIAAAIQLEGKAEYVGHKSYRIESGAWVEVQS